MDDYFVRMKGDILVNVPSSPAFLTTYVLLELEDWFEREIRFVRRYLKPGMHVIDIGASFGVYALTMAKAVQPGGEVTAFEPTPATAAMLRKSIERNGFANLHLVPAALSAREGTAELHVYENTELNSLTALSTGGGCTEQVTVSTLDRQQRDLQWPAIDFVKIDAEGEEQNVIEGGERFLSEQSPLVMFEIAREGRNIHVTLPAFRRLGYDVYRLIGPDAILVPVGSEAETVVEYNLFCCKPDRAERLASAGSLAMPGASPARLVRGAADTLLGVTAYASAFGPLSSRDAVYREAFDCYAAWYSSGASATERFANLRSAFSGMERAARDIPSLARLSSLARCAIEAGEWRVAIRTLDRLLQMLTSNAAAPDEPFLPAAKRYDQIAPGGATQAWMLAATFEAAEILSTPTGYFRVDNALMRQLHEWYTAAPFASPEMERRRQLMRLRSGQQSGLLSTPILERKAPDNLNADLWGGSP